VAEVTVYTTPTCPWCNRLKDFLQEEGIAYNEVNVAEDPEGAKRMVKLTSQRSVPVTIIGEQIVIGYNPEGIKELLG
jgi:glutaredoxin-like YruB-family protein